MEKHKMSCIDCAVKNCNKMDKTYPDFCLITHMDESVLNEAMACYEEEENHQIMVAAAEVEFEHYCQYTRIEEIAVGKGTAECDRFRGFLKKEKEYVL